MVKSPHPDVPAQSENRAAKVPADADSLTDLRALYAEHGQFVWLTLQRMGVPRDDVEDALQEVFIIVHRRGASYDRNAKLSAWLYGICRRVAAHQRRRAYRRREIPSALEELPRATDSADSPEQALDRRRRQAVLDAVLAKLDIDRRAVFVMYEIEAMSCEAIASLVGAPVGTIYSRLHKARKEFLRAAERQRKKLERGQR